MLQEGSDNKRGKNKKIIIQVGSRGKNEISINIFDMYMK